MHYVLTVAREKRQPQNDGYVAVISIGSPQKGDTRVIICDVEVVKSMKDAKVWFKKQMEVKPWMDDDPVFVTDAFKGIN